MHSSRGTTLDDKFMDTVSAYDGLAHVVFQVHSVTAIGIATLIENSLNLLTYLFGLCKINRYKGKYLNFDHRKLFTSGLYLSEQVEGQNFVKAIEWLQNPNLLTFRRLCGFHRPH